MLIFFAQKNRRWKQSVALSKQDKLFKDAMETAAESRDVEVAEDLIQFFVEKGFKDCFAAALYVCYDLLRPDVVLELAWRYRITDLAMPYLIQLTREYVQKVDNLEKSNQERTQKEEIKEKQGMYLCILSINLFNFLVEMTSIAPLNAPLMLTAAPAWGQGGYAAQPGYTGANPMYPGF